MIVVIYYSDFFRNDFHTKIERNYSSLNSTHQLTHRVREAIASGMLRFMHVPGNLNPADILSKAWAYNQVWPILKSILFWEGESAKFNQDTYLGPYTITTVRNNGTIRARKG